jgi:hypothetical protein
VSKGAFESTAGAAGASLKNEARSVRATASSAKYQKV